MKMPVPAPAATLDIEFPLKTRGGDCTDAKRGSSTCVAADAANERPTSSAPVRRAPVPFLVQRLLAAPGPFGLAVELKSEGRVVGTWSIEVNPRDAGTDCVSQVKADLYVCASARGDARATGAFLVIRQWWGRVSDREQLEQLYEGLSVAVLERLGALMEGGPDEIGESNACVLFLVDGRRLDRTLFSLDRLQIRILEDLESDHAIAGMQLRVAHGRGTGTRPNVVFASTQQAADSRPGAVDQHAGNARISLANEVFVRETVSAENLRWNRRASDRALAMRGLPAVALAAQPASLRPRKEVSRMPD
jgi:hypothetical protein